MLAGMMKSHRFNFILDQRFILLAQSPKILFFANEIQRTVFPHNLVVLCLEIFNLSQYPLKVLLTLAKMSMILLFPEGKPKTTKKSSKSYNYSGENKCSRSFKCPTEHLKPKTRAPSFKFSLERLKNLFFPAQKGLETYEF